MTSSWQQQARQLEQVMPGLGVFMRRIVPRRAGRRAAADETLTFLDELFILYLITVI